MKEQEAASFEAAFFRYRDTAPLYLLAKDYSERAGRRTQRLQHVCSRVGVGIDLQLGAESRCCLAPIACSRESGDSRPNKTWEFSDVVAVYRSEPAVATLPLDSLDEVQDHLKAAQCKVLGRYVNLWSK